MPNPTNPTILYRGQYITVIDRAGWECVQRNRISGIVGLVAVTDAGNLVLVEQYRAPLDARVVELPAGLAGDEAGHEHEPLLEAARRELLEETGYEAARFEHLFDGAASAGLSNEVITFYLATGLRKVGPGAGDGTEQITVLECPLANAHAWLQARARDGRIIDSKVYAGLYFAHAWEKAGKP